jgi:hypothetical protein
MANINFTAKQVRSYQCDKGKPQSILWDSGAKGLGVRATANGSKVYVFRFKLKRLSPRIKIGSLDTWTIPAAREEARRLQRLLDQGLDPREVKSRELAKQDATAAEKAGRKLLARTAWNAYLKAPHSQWGNTHRKDHQTAAQEGGTQPKIGKILTKPAPLASLLCQPLHDITSEVVAAWLKQECKARPTFTKNCYRKFRSFINWCASNPDYKTAVQPDCCLTNAVTQLLPPNKTKEGDCLQKEQLSTWFQHVRSISNPAMSAYLQCLLLTGARREELLILQWADVDFEWKKMTIRDKVDDSGKRAIPLTPHVSTLLAALPRRNKWIFSSPTAKEGHIVGVTKPHNAAIKAAGIPHVSLHGLRRSFATLSEWVEVPTGIVAQIQGHKPSAIAEKHYVRRSIDLLRMYHVKLESWMLNEAGIEIPKGIE